MPVRETLLPVLLKSFSELRMACTSFGGFLREQFDEIERIRTELESYADSVAQREAELSRESEELRRQRIELDEQTQRLANMAIASECATPAGTSSDTGGLELEKSRRLAELEQETEQLRQRLADAEERAAASEHHRSEAERINAELASANAEIERLRLNTVDQGEVELPENIQRLEQERNELEQELEVVRTRAAELREALTEQQRLRDERQSEWSSELQTLRRALEQQVQIFEASRVSASGQRSSPEESAHSPSAAVHQEGADDVVLGSIMEQFERLQRDKIDRQERLQRTA